MPGFETIILMLRIPQALFTIIVLGTTGYTTNQFNDDLGFTFRAFNYLLFVSIWTLLALIFLAGVATFVKALAHPIILLAVDGLTMIFWFTGFIAAAAIIGDYDDFISGTAWTTIKAATAFGAFNWALFVATTVLDLLFLLKGRKTGGASSAAPYAAPVAETGPPPPQQQPYPPQGEQGYPPQPYPPQQGVAPATQPAAPYPAGNQENITAMPTQQSPYA